MTVNKLVEDNYIEFTANESDYMLNVKQEQ